MSQPQFRLRRVDVKGPATLRLRYADDAVFMLDMTSLLRKLPSLSALKKESIFATARIAEHGGVVRWNNSDDLEMAADNLRARAVEQQGGCSHEQIWNWMARHELTVEGAAEALGLSRRMLSYYRSGAKPVPRVVQLALLGWEHRHEAA